MKKSDKIELRRLEAVKKLNELNRLDTLTDEQRAEETALLDEHDKLTQERENALRYEATQPEIEQREEQTPAAPEQREWSSLVNQIEVRNFMYSILADKPLDGREAEVRSELHLASNQIPFEAICPREERATAVTAAPTTVGAQQQSIIQRVFADTSAAYLGVNMPTVGVGETLYPILTAGVAAEQKAKDAAVESTAGTIESHKLAPVRLTAQYLWRREDQAVLAGLEEALRADIRMALGDALDVQVLTGDGAAPNVTGFLTELTAPADTDAAGDKVDTFATFVRKTSSGIDGKFAHDLGELRTLMGVDSYVQAANTFHTSGDAVSAQAYLQQRTGGVRSSANMAATASTKQKAIVYRTGAGQTHAYAPVWQGVTILRDELKHADKGQILVTALMLWAFKIVREDAFKTVEYKVSS